MLFPPIGSFAPKKMIILSAIDFTARSFCLLPLAGLSHPIKTEQDEYVGLDLCILQSVPLSGSARSLTKVEHEKCFKLCSFVSLLVYVSLWPPAAHAAFAFMKFHNSFEGDRRLRLRCEEAFFSFPRGLVFDFPRAQKRNKKSERRSVSCFFFHPPS